MLPDQPSFKNDLQGVLIQYLQRQIHSRMGVFRQSPHHVVHEGERQRIIRADGSIEDSNLKEASSEMSVKMDDVPRQGLRDIITQLDRMADEIARRRFEIHFSSLNEVLEHTGQTVGHKDKPFDAETLFAALEKMQVDFNSDGDPEFQIICPPAMRPRFTDVLNGIDADPQLKRRYEDLMARKKADCHAREVARKLVG